MHFGRTNIMFYNNMSLRKIVIHDINATPHWSFFKYLTLKMELFLTTINSFKVLTLVKKSSIFNKTVFKKTWISETGFANIRLKEWKDFSRPYLLFVFTIFCFTYITFFRKSDMFWTFRLFLRLLNVKSH